MDKTSAKLDEVIALLQQLIALQTPAKEEKKDIKPSHWKRS